MKLMTAAECAEIAKNSVRVLSDKVLEKCLKAALDRIRSYAEDDRYQCDLSYGDIGARVSVSLGWRNRQLVMDYVTRRLIELEYRCVFCDTGIVVSWAHALKKRQDPKEGE